MPLNSKSIELARISEIISLVKDRDAFFSNFEEDYGQNPSMARYYQAYNQALMTLEEKSWEILRTKLVVHYEDHRAGQHKQGFFNRMNEAFAYQYLQRLSYQDIRFIPEVRNQRTPDICYRVDTETAYCEVKTLGVSENEIIKRNTFKVGDHTEYAKLADGALNKFVSDVREAKKQIEEYSGSSKGLAFTILNFDDFTLEYFETYKHQLLDISRQHGLGRLDFYETCWPVAIIHFT